MEKKKSLSKAMGRSNLKNGLFWVYGMAAVTSFTVFVVFWCTSVFRDAILSCLVLRNESTAFIWWQHPPVGLTYKVYVFNYTNVEEFERGEAEKLRVQEVGPYVYKERLSRVNVDVHENGTVTYQENRTFEWLSGSPEDEPIVVPNVPLMTTVAFSRDTIFPVKLMLTVALSTLSSKPFVNVPAGGFLWGYDDSIFNMLKPIISLQKPVSVEKFGVLAFKRGVNEDRITMNTGSPNIQNLGMIERINGMNTRNVWNDEKCDRVYGTDGSMFPPHLITDPNNTLYVYAKDMCRNIPFRFDRRTFSYGIPTLRYKIPADVFNFTSEKDPCFCSKKLEDGEYKPTTCPPAGIFNLSVCSSGSPILASFPHFYMGDEWLFDQIDGLDPQPSRHETYFDLHPRLGIPMHGWSRFQLNLEVRKAQSIPFSGKLKDGSILPLIWIDSGIDSLPGAVLTAFERAHYVANAVEAGLQWCSLIGVVFSFSALLAVLRKNSRIEATTGLQRNSSGQDKLLE